MRVGKGQPQAEPPVSAWVVWEAVRVATCGQTAGSRAGGSRAGWVVDQ